LDHLIVYDNCTVFRSFPTRRSSDLSGKTCISVRASDNKFTCWVVVIFNCISKQMFVIRIFLDNSRNQKIDNVFFYGRKHSGFIRSEEHTSELQSREKLVCRLLLEKK